MLDDLQLDQITDPQAREVIRRLLNLVETLSAEVDWLKTENQHLRDENNRLKGEQGRPKGPQGRPPATDISSEAERRVPRGRVKGPKNHEIHIDREERRTVDPAVLPPDAQFKGLVSVIVQDLVLRTDNVRFRKEKWYAPSTGQTYLGEVPAGYEGQFGPKLKSLAADQCRADQPAQTAGGGSLGGHQQLQRPSRTAAHPSAAPARRRCDGGGCGQSRGNPLAAGRPYGHAGQGRRPAVPHPDYTPGDGGAHATGQGPPVHPLHPMVTAVTRRYQTGVKRTKAAMVEVERHLTRDPQLGKWFLMIHPDPVLG